MYKGMLSDEDGRLSGSRTALAGFGAGVTESALAVTPFESIKTQMFGFSGGVEGSSGLVEADKRIASMIASALTRVCEDFSTDLL